MTHTARGLYTRCSGSRCRSKQLLASPGSCGSKPLSFTVAVSGVMCLHNRNSRKESILEQQSSGQELTTVEVASWPAGWDEIQKRTGSRVARTEPRQRVRRYVEGVPPHRTLDRPLPSARDARHVSLSPRRSTAAGARDRVARPPTESSKSHRPPGLSAACSCDRRLAWYTIDWERVGMAR